MTPSLYMGHVVHTRLRPVRHRLRYRMLTVLLDIDRLPANLRLFSPERFNLFSFFARDHLAGDGTPLRTQIESHLADANIATEGGPIRLLCMPRVLGRVFNPLSVFFCHHKDGPLRAVLYEVNNTFGQRHTYLLPVTDPDAPTHRQACAKRFHVSPFMDMDMQYRFRLAQPGPRAGIAIAVHDATGPILSAVFAGTRTDLTDANLARAFLRHPFLAAQVLAGIHWEAVKLFAKGLRLRPIPPAPTNAITLPEPV